MKYNSYIEYIEATSLTLNEMKNRLGDLKAEENWYRKQREEEEDKDRWAGGLYRRD